MSNEMDKPGMSTAERLELSKVVRLRAKVAKNDVMASIAQQLANVEKQLAARYSGNEVKWAELKKDAEKTVMRADAELAKRCREMGIPESFRPELRVNWYSRGENADKERRTELRNVAESELEARAQRAKCAIERAEAELLTQITADGLTTKAARTFLEALPTVDQLMPNLQLSDLEKRRPLLDVGPDLDE
jgi:hypothetical protein